MSDTQKFWQEDFGDQYHIRNRVDWTKRRPFWNEIIAITHARSVFEAGSGPGWNLTAIKYVRPEVATWGCEINQNAQREAMRAGHSVVHLPITSAQLGGWPGFDLTFTVGCLIHIPPAELEKAMKTLITLSAGYVLSVEYHAEQEEMIEYRGNQDKLWKRPYGNLYQDLGLKQMASGFLAQSEGFDCCTWDLLAK